MLSQAHEFFGPGSAGNRINYTEAASLRCSIGSETGTRRPRESRASVSDVFLIIVVKIAIARAEIHFHTPSYFSKRDPRTRTHRQRPVTHARYLTEDCFLSLLALKIWISSLRSPRT